MSIFNITDVTPAGAFCNAMKAAAESDRRASRHTEVEHKANERHLARQKIGLVARTLGALHSGLNHFRLEPLKRSRSA